MSRGLELWFIYRTLYTGAVVVGFRWRGWPRSRNLTLWQQSKGPLTAGRKLGFLRANFVEGELEHPAREVFAL